MNYDEYIEEQSMIDRLYNVEESINERLTQLFAEYEENKDYPDYDEEIEKCHASVDEIRTAICILNICDALEVSQGKAANMLFGYLASAAIALDQKGSDSQFLLIGRMGIIGLINGIAKLIAGANKRIASTKNEIVDERKARARAYAEQQLREEEARENERLARDRAKRAELAERRKRLAPYATKLMGEFGIYEAQAYALTESGYKTPEDIQNASVEELLSIKNVGQGTLRALKGMEY